HRSVPRERRVDAGQWLRGPVLLIRLKSGFSSPKSAVRLHVCGTGYEGNAMPEAVLAEVSDGVAVITINRPEARNAVNGDVARGIAAAVDEFDASKDVQVLVLTGAGGTFSAGM